MKNTHDLVIDRAHRTAKPNTLPDTVPMDVLARIHFFISRTEPWLQPVRQGKLPDPYSHISIYADLSAATLAWCRQFALITDVLRERKIVYNWLFPATLQVTHQGQKYILYSPTETEKTFPAMEYTCTLSKCECLLQSSSFLNKRPELNFFFSFFLLKNVYTVIFFVLGLESQLLILLYFPFKLVAYCSFNCTPLYFKVLIDCLGK